MTFYNPDELSSYGQDIEQLRQEQNDRLLSRPPVAPPAQGGSGLAQALIQQLNSQQGASPPSSLGEALQRALQVAGQTMQAYGQHQAGIDPNRNNPETLRNRLLQKAIEEQLMQERMLTTQGQQIQAGQALENLRNTNRTGLEGVRHGNAMELNATPKALAPEMSANLRSQTTTRDTLLPHQVGKMTAQEEEALAKTRYLEGANNDQPGGSIINPTSIPADAQPLADINPTTGAVTPAPGQTIAPRELRSLQDALGGGRPTFPPPKRVRKTDTINGPTFGYEKSPEELAYNAGLKTTATEGAKQKAERQLVDPQATLAIDTIDQLSKSINTAAPGVGAWLQGVGREGLSMVGMDPEIKQYTAARNTLTPIIARGVENLKGRLPVMDQRWVNESAFPIPTDPEPVRTFKVGLLRLMKRAADGEDVAGEIHSLITNQAPDATQPQGGAPTTPQGQLRTSGGALSPIGQSVVDEWRSRQR